MNRYCFPSISASGDCGHTIEILLSDRPAMPAGRCRSRASCTIENGVAHWNAFVSAEKTMHINPSPSLGITFFERDPTLAFFNRHLDGET
jgi:hypothetical protein